MPVRASVAIGLVGTALAVVLVGSLHVLYAGDVDPVRRTISEYALRDLGWMFDTGVLALAAGSVAVLIALVRAGLVRWPSFAAAGMLVSAAGMVAVVVFEKTNWAVGPSVGGVIHRYASLAAFLALQVERHAPPRAKEGVVGHGYHSRPLDPDHFRAVIGQHHRREWPGAEPCHLDDFQSGKRARHAFGLAPNRRAARGAGVRNGKGLRAFRHPSGGTLHAFDDDGPSR